MREVLRAVFKTGSGSAISMLLNVVSSKIIAVITGPFGIGFYSMIQQLVRTASTAGAIGGGGVALTQGVACRKNQARDDFIVAVFWIFTIGAFLTSLALLFFAPWIALFAFGVNDEATVWLVRWLALPVALMIALTYLNGVLNGFREIGRLALIQITGSGVTAILSYPVSILVDTGYFVAFIGMMTISISAQIIVGLIKAYRQKYLHPIILNGFRLQIRRDAANSFFQIAGTLFFTSIFSSVILLVVRALIVQYNSLADAGIFNVAWVICMGYPIIILGSFGTYYFPTLSKATKQHERLILITDVFRLSTLLIVPLLIIMIVLKPLIIDIFYSEEFYNSLTIMRWMLIGIYFKTATWVFAMPMLAFADMKIYFWTENFWFAGFLGFSLLAVVTFSNLEIIGLGFLVLYAIYLIYTIHYTHSRHGFTLNKRWIIIWVNGLILIIVASILTWSETRIDVPMTIIWVAVSISFLLLSITKQERRHLWDIVIRRKI